MGKASTKHPIVALQRPAGSFAPFPEGLNVPQAQLELWLQALSVQPISAVAWTCLPEWSLGPRSLQDNMWFYILSGKAEGHVGTAAAQRFALKAGDFMLMPQDISHCVRHDPADPLKVLAVHFHAHVYGINLLHLLGFPAHLSQCPDDPYRRNSEAFCREYALKRPGWTQAATAAIVEILLHLLRHYGHAFNPLGYPSTWASSNHTLLPRMLPALAAIEAELGDTSLSVSMLAERVHLSDVQFRKLFCQATGLSPVKFIQRRRIEQACRLLRTTDMNIDGIASTCGFSDTPFFCRIFKRWIRLSPGMYRTSNRL